MGLTQEKFAALMGFKRAAQCHYENGRRTPSVECLQQMASHGVDILYLLTETEDKKLDAETFSQRLKAERKRLGHTQQEIAGLCGIRREMWVKYEAGSAEPSYKVLEHFDLHGADVLYILTGRKELKPQADTPSAELGASHGR